MKKNHFLIVLLLVANILPASAKIEKIFSTETLCNVTIEVDEASNVIIATKAGRGTPLTLTNGTNTLELNDSEKPLSIKAAEGAEIVSCFVDGDKKTPNGGAIRVAITEGMNIVITTKSLSTTPIVTFSVTDPSHVIVKADGVLVEDISSPKEFAKGTVLTIAPATGYEIKVSTNLRPDIPFTDGVYLIRVDQDMTVNIISKLAEPVVTFEVDFPERIKVVDQSTREPIDISSLKVTIPKGTVLEIQASNENYSITSVKVDGTDKAPTTGGKIYNVDVEANMTVTIETSSMIPSVNFVVDYAENVKIHKVNSEEMLDVTKMYEMEKNTQLVIEPANDEVRIASVIANGIKLTPSENGIYITAVTTNLTIEIKTKAILPILTFNVDAPERIQVMAGTEKLDISEAVELAIGTEITVEPAAESFIIKSVMADGKAIIGSDNKYLITISGNMNFDIRTAASLTLHIIQPDEGGTLSVFRNEKELHEGDKVTTYEKLTFKSEPENGYFLAYYIVNNKECSDTYTVGGSDDINVGVIFKPIRNGYVEVEFDLDEGGNLLNIYNIDGSEKTTLDPSKASEVKKDSQIEVFMLSEGTKITSCTLNGVEVPADGEEGQDARTYTMTVEDDAIIVVRTAKLVNVWGDITYDENNYNPIGRIQFRYEDKIDKSFFVPVGATVEVIPEPVEGYMFDYCYISYDENNKLEGNTYTVENADKELIAFKGAFKKIPDGIESVNSLQSHYDAETMQIVTTGGNTKVYTVSGKIVLESNETNISVSALESGIYIVKTYEGVFKLVKK